MDLLSIPKKLTATVQAKLVKQMEEYTVERLKEVARKRKWGALGS